MAVRQLKPNVYWVGAIDWDLELFDSLIPVPDGTSYNSYIVIGSQKTALIDTVEINKFSELLDNLNTLNIQHLDYIISNHAEQDHSGSIVKLINIFPDAKIVTNSKCKDILVNFYSIPDEKFNVINDKDVISLGDKSLEFIIAPWVHWPDTMMTHLKEDKILFTCDFLGSHIASSELFVNDESRVYYAAKRYYAQIMMPFRNNVKSNLDKVIEIKPDMIAPSHGQVYNKPEFIINCYKEWISDKVENQVIIPYITMHGSTQKMVDYFVNSLMDKGISVRPFNLVNADTGELAMAIVNAATIVIASPTVLVGPHPKAVYATYLINALRPKTKFISIIGSYSWGGKLEDSIKGMLTNIKAQMLSCVIAKGAPKQDDYTKLDSLADEIANRHKEL